MRKIRRSSFWILTILLCMLFPFAVKASAKASDENDTKETAQKIKINTIVEGTLEERMYSPDVDWYQFELPSTGYVKLTFTSEIKSFRYYLYELDKETGRFIRYGSYNMSSGDYLTWDTVTWDAATETANHITELYLAKGTYCLSINGHALEEEEKYTGKYTITSEFISSNVNHSEHNYSMATACDITYNQQYESCMTKQSMTGEYFKVEVKEAGKLAVEVTTYDGSINITCMDSNGTEFGGHSYNYNRTHILYDEQKKMGHEIVSYNVLPGTYYLKIMGQNSYIFFPKDTYPSYSTMGNYSIKILTPTLAEKIELDIPSATVSPGDTFDLSVNYYPENAYYHEVKWESSDQDVAIVYNGTVRVLRPGYTEITARTVDGSNQVAICKVYSRLKKPGNVKVKAINYHTLSLSWNKVDYADKYEVYRATSKNGTYKKITTTLKTKYTNKNLTTNKTYYYKVVAVKSGATAFNSAKTGARAGKPVLNAPTFKLSSAGKGKVKVTFSKKITGATGYQVQYKTKKASKYQKLETYKKNVKFTARKSGLKLNMTYQFRVRAYRSVKGKTYYSSWTTKSYYVSKYYY